MAEGRVWVDGTQQSIWAGKDYFTGTATYSITLSGRTGYKRTWTVSRSTEYFGNTTFFSNTLPVPTSSYDVYIYNWTDAVGTRFYANTEWRFTKSDLPNKYTLSYDADGGTLRGGTTAGDHNYNTTITLPTTKTKTGHTFNNFTKNGIIISDTSFNLPANDTEVVANWNINKYTVTYLSTTPSYFNFTSSSDRYDFNTPLTATVININIDPPRVIGEVYSFDKWTYNDGDLGTRRLPANNINLQANWIFTSNSEIHMNELSTVFDNFQVNYYENIRISNYFDQLQLSSPSDKKNVNFSTKLKGKGTF